MAKIISSAICQCYVPYQTLFLKKPNFSTFVKSISAKEDALKRKEKDSSFTDAYRNLINRYRFLPGFLPDNISEEINELLRENRIIKTYHRGRYLFHEGSVPRGVFYLEEGIVYIFKTDEEGREQIIYFYRKGDLFGYRPILCNEPHPVSAVALEDSILSFIPRDVFLQVLAQSGELARKLLENLSFEYTVWTNNVYLFSRKPVKVRVALALLLLSDLFGIRNRPGLFSEFRISREVLAAFTGTVKETLVRNLTLLKEKGIISTQGQKISIVRPEQLLKIINDE
jgi:CRP-like cAMP-binding protein